jgi:hypothetical protein
MKFLEGCAWATLILVGFPCGFVAACSLFTPQQPHNEYSGVAAGIGMIASAAFCAATALFFVVRYSYRDNIKDDGWRYILIVTASLAGFAAALWHIVRTP